MEHQRGSFGRLLTFLPLAGAPLDGPIPSRTVARRLTTGMTGTTGAEPSRPRSGLRAVRFARRAAGRLVRGLKGRG
jgi:hypothetical protein